MCAINGFNFKDEKLIVQMNAVTRRRGPDGTGVFTDEGISLGHNRLSIIDLTDAASQPMQNNDGNLVIVFNGEIYNFLELKRELAGSYQFKTLSDTEIILAAYQKWGAECVKKFNGIFAFVIWDKLKRELFLARDPIGVKPLYYFWDSRKFIFSSEIKAILEHNVSRVLDKEAFNHYLRLLYVPEPLTMFEGVRKFPPASYALLKNNKFTTYNYWDLKTKEKFFGTNKKLAVELREKVEQAVKSQLISDRPLGIYLSGGIDSSVVLDCVAKVRDNIDTFSVGFNLKEKEQKEKFNADFNLARRTAEYYGTNHHEVLLSPQDVLDLLDRVVWQMDEPISNPTAIAMMKLAEFTKNKADVVLGGDGGDELFGGYDRYRLSLAANYYQKLPKLFRGAIAKFSQKAGKLNVPAGIERYALFMFQKDEILRKSISEEFLDFNLTKNFFNKKFKFNDRSAAFEEILMEVDRKSWLADFSLILTDKMSMAFGLEARVPFLDKNLVEFAAKIPLKYKISLFNNKIILKEAFYGRIPNFLFNQPKRGWFSPAAKWLRYPEMQKMIKEVLSENYCESTRRIFRWRKLQDIFEGHCFRGEYNLNIIWAILTFQIWAKQYKIQI
ncbi:MAG: asparagine synthase (glutamine-hydrolyzing) [Candidatus Niyogibacteria bacterium]|nr:asparagine synthase (glutamine-hydrolyzing) [Candidatus Niyogibacteria bacterium]